MARTPGNQHPALRGGAITKVDEGDLEIVGLFHTQEWEGVEGRSKDFLLKYVMKRDVRRVVEELSLDMEWFTYEEKHNRDFAWCIQKIVDHPKEVAKQIMDEALCESALVLVGLLRSTNERVQLEAIKQLHNVTSVGGQHLMDGAAKYMNVNINMDAFRGPPNGKIIDA